MKPTTKSEPTPSATTTTAENAAAAALAASLAAKVSKKKPVIGPVDTLVFNITKERKFYLPSGVVGPGKNKVTASEAAMLMRDYPTQIIGTPVADTSESKQLAEVMAELAQVKAELAAAKKS